MRLTTTVLLALLLVGVADAQRGQRRVIRGSSGEVLNRRGDFYAAVGGNPARLGGLSISTSALPKGVYEITLQNTGTGWEEVFLLGVPTNPIVPAPCLVVHHGYGQEPKDMVSLTSYFQEAMARGWVVLAPLGAHKYNYAIDYAQINVEVAITWAATVLTLDPDRFYAVGFSMGGGMASSFASRHLDEFGPRFAAVVVHTGTCSMRDSYWSADDKSLMKGPQMFDATPDEDPFRYQIASSIDLDTFTDTVGQDTDLVRNLKHTPIYHFAALGDPNPFLINQTEKDHDQALLRGAESVYVTSNDSVHRWYTLDETTVLDWMEPLTFQGLVDGRSTRILADRSDRWFGIALEQAATGQFTPLRWTGVASQNRVYVDEVENAASIGFDPEDFGLDQSSTVELVFNNTDGLAVAIVLEGYTSVPVDVQRGGVSTSSWSYDAAADTVTLHEIDGAAYPLWAIIP